MKNEETTLGEVFMEYGLSWFKEEYGGSLELRTRNTVFSDALTVWLMVAQKGTKENSLASAVQELKSTSKLEDVAKLVAGSRKFKFDEISDNPGALCVARQRVALDKVEAFSDHMSKKIAQENEDLSLINGYRSFVMDGSTIGLEGDARIVQEFPRQSNQHGESQPAARVVVAHDVVTGIAYRPEIGSIEVSEQALSHSLMKRLPRKSLVIADRNFGVFSVAWHAREASLIPLVRLQEQRAKMLFEKEEITHDCERSIIWVPSKSDRKRNDFPQDARLKGRVIAITLRVPQRRDERFYFFTTADDLTPEQVLEIYHQRWLIETDLRSIKSAVHLDMVYARTPDVAKKEIILGVLAYSLIRTIIARGSKLIGINPRKISFTGARRAIITMGVRLKMASSVKEVQLLASRFLSSMKQAKLPNRTKHRTEPRVIARSMGRNFPKLKGSREDARQKLIMRNMSGTYTGC